MDTLQRDSRYARKIGDGGPASKQWFVCEMNFGIRSLFVLRGGNVPFMVYLSFFSKKLIVLFHANFAAALS